MSKVKIGDKEYAINYLKFGVAKRIVKKKEEKKLDQLDYNSYILAEVINACNPDAKMTIEKFDDSINITEFEKIQKDIMEFSGFNKFFKPGVGKK